MFKSSAFSLRLCGSNAFRFAFSADSSLIPAATAPKLHSGGHTGAVRGIRAISAASADPSAA